MIRSLISILLLSLFFIMVIGCDEDPPVVTEDAVRTIVVAKVLVRPYIDCQLFLQPIYGQELEIDSVKLDDSLCTITKRASFVYGNNYSYFAIYTDESDSLRYSAGDNVTIRMFEGNDTTAVEILLLDWTDDSPNVITAESDAGVDVGDPITITWNKVENADWYGIYQYFRTGSSFFHESTHDFFATSDTTFLIPGTFVSSEGTYRVRIESVTGPVPNIESYNIDGTTTVGSAYGISDNRVHVTIVGDGESDL